MTTDKFELPPRELEKPFRLCASDVYKASGSTVTVSGRVESGFVAVGDNVLVTPGVEIGAVKSIKKRDEPRQFVGAGDNAELAVTGVDIAHISVGMVRISEFKLWEAVS